MRPLRVGAVAGILAIALAGCSGHGGHDGEESPSRDAAGVQDAAPAAGAGTGESEDHPLQVGSVREVSLETPHPYLQGEEGAPVWQETIEHAGASFLKVHFVEVDLARGETAEDFVVIRDKDGVERQRFAASDVKPSGELWALSVDGDRVVVELHAPVGGGEGFRIDRYGHGEGPG